MNKKYEYAVMDGNRGLYDYESPESCHHTKEAATKAASRLNAQDPNAHYCAVHWCGSRWARQQLAACIPVQEVQKKGEI